jgi:prephenate dehydrogenase
MKIGILSIVGVGLIGGSIGLAVRQRKLAERVRGIGWRQQALDEAISLGAIDNGTLNLREGVVDADAVIFCTPVAGMVEQILTVAASAKRGTLLTDVGSTKAVIVGEVENRLPAGVDFVGSHPLAGSEKRGVRFADATLFEGRLAIVTKTPKTSAVALERTKALWEALGSQVRVMNPSEHDRAVAITSHLPHLLAATLAGILPPELTELTASGFRDTTRIAAGDPGLWSGIFGQNRTAVLAALAMFRERLQRIQDALERDDVAEIKQWLESAQKIREGLGDVTS